LPGRRGAGKRPLIRRGRRSTREERASLWAENPRQPARIPIRPKRGENCSVLREKEAISTRRGKSSVSKVRRKEEGGIYAEEGKKGSFALRGRECHCRREQISFYCLEKNRERRTLAKEDSFGRKKHPNRKGKKKINPQKKKGSPCSKGGFTGRRERRGLRREKKEDIGELGRVCVEKESPSRSVTLFQEKERRKKF